MANFSIFLACRCHTDQFEMAALHKLAKGSFLSIDLIILNDFDFEDFFSNFSLRNCKFVIVFTRFPEGHF